MKSLYVASLSKGGGIYRYEINGKCAEQKQFVPLDRPMYLIENGGKMYAVLREINGESAVVCFDIDKDGNLVNGSSPISTKGTVGCHLCVSDEKVFAAHYGSGNLFVSPDTSLKFYKNSKLHFVSPTPDGKYLAVCDIGRDSIYILNKDLSLKSEVKLKEKSGARHLCFDSAGQYAYCTLETSSEVAGFSYKDGVLKHLGTVSSLENGFEGNNTASAIRILGDRLFVSNRGQDSVSVFSVNGGEMSLVKSIWSRGNCPRDIFACDNILVCANLNSDNVALFKIKDNDVIEFLTEIKVGAPLCALMRG